MTITIMLNGASQTLDKVQSVSDFLAADPYEGKLVAVAINGEFVPRSQHETRMIADQDDLEIVAPMQGG